MSDRQTDRHYLFMHHKIYLTASVILWVKEKEKKIEKLQMC